MRDEVFLQEVGSQIASTEPLTSVIVRSGEIVVGSRIGLHRVDSQQFAPVGGFPRVAVRRLVTTRDATWILSSEGMHRWTAEGFRRISREQVQDVCEFRGEIIAALGSKLFRVVDTNLVVVSTNECRFAITRVVDHQENLWVHGPGRLAPFDGVNFGGRDVYDSWSDQAWDWGDLPSRVSREILPLGNRMMIATERGVGVLRGMAMTSLRSTDGLCVEDVTCLARGFTNDIWMGSTRGAMRMVDGKFHYFAGRRWLPSDRVNAVLVSGNRVLLATDGGLGMIDLVPMTLASKAAYYEQHLEEWGQKRLGLVQKLEWDAGLKEFVREAGDNDGGYSGDYLAAESYRFAVTGETEARQNAVETFRGLKRLETITGIRGFPARSIWFKGERGHKSTSGSGGYPAEWHEARDSRFEWKGDTSSDEICSHFYAFGVFLERAAQEGERPAAIEHLAEMARHLLKNGWRLLDVDGKPTRWGRWDPEYFRTDEGRFDRGLQSLELLSFMKMAGGLTADPELEKGYRDLVEMGYPGYTLRQRSTFPPENVAHFEDQLAFWCYWNLLGLEKDPMLHAMYRRSYERSYEAVRVERNPWFNFIYGTLTGHDFDVQGSVEHLREWPLDLRVWSYSNSHRDDLRTPPGHLAVMGGRVGLSPRETEPMRWDHWTMQEDGGSDGNDVVEPSAWLLAYWMGRFHGMISAPDPSAMDLPRVPPLRNGMRGASRYDGPIPME